MDFFFEVGNRGFECHGEHQAVVEGDDGDAGADAFGQDLLVLIENILGVSYQDFLSRKAISYLSGDFEVSSPLLMSSCWE